MTSAPNNRLILLGVKGGPAVRPKSAMPTASLLQLNGQNIVVDCGIGVTRSLVDTGITLMDIDAIFITHLHSDHVLELGPLLYTAWTTGLRQPIRIYGPEGINAYWENFLAAMQFDHDIRIDDEGRAPIRDLIEINTYGPGEIARLGRIDVTALRVCHPPVTDTFALRFKTETQCIVFSADTCYFEPLADFAYGADVLVHEAMLSSGVDALVARTGGGSKLRAHLMASHTPAADVGRIARHAKVGKLVLHHMVPIDDPDFTEDHWQREVSRSWDGPTLVGRDGMAILLD